MDTLAVGSDVAVEPSQSGSGTPLTTLMQHNEGKIWSTSISIHQLDSDVFTIWCIFPCAPMHTVAQTTVPMFACFALNSILCDRTLIPSKSMSVWNKVLTHGVLAIQESEDLVKIWLNGSHTKMATHWDSFLTLHFYYIY